MNKEQLQKLAGLLKEKEDFDLSDNPISGYPKTITITLNTDTVLDALDRYWDVKDRDITKELVLQIQKQIQDIVANDYTSGNNDYLGDLWNGGVFDFLTDYDDYEGEDINEEEDFDLSDNPIRGGYYKVSAEVSATIRVSRVVKASSDEQAYKKAIKDKFIEETEEIIEYDDPFNDNQEDFDPDDFEVEEVSKPSRNNIKEEEDFDLSDNPVGESRRGVFTFNVSRTTTVWEKAGPIKVSFPELKRFVEEFGMSDFTGTFEELLEPKNRGYLKSELMYYMYEMIDPDWQLKDEEIQNESIDIIDIDTKTLFRHDKPNS